jgi:signal recognition particle GTPase
MWTPWTVVAGTVADWSRRTQEVAVDNARAAAVECSRALVERIEVELYVAELNEQRVQQRERPSVIA